MATSRVMTVAFLGALVLCPGRGVARAESGGVAAQAKRHVVDDAEIQSRLDSRASQESADRQTIRHLLQRPEVRRIAASARLDLRRANAAAAVLSGQQLKDVAAQARAADSQFGGRNGQVTLTYTAIIIILLVLIIILVA